MTVISLAPQDDDLAVIDAVVPLLEDSFPLSTLAARPDHVPGDFWTQVADLGWIVAPLEETSGGGGFDCVQDMLMHREYGRWLAPVALLATALGARVLARSTGEIPPTILTGSERIGFAMFVDATRVDADAAGTVHLIDAGADRFLIAGPDGAAVVARSAITDIVELAGIDPTQTLARGTLTGVMGAWLSAADEPIALQMQLLLAAQLTGVALAASRMAAEYAKIREQFGKPIGAFQAVAHLCADASVRALAADAAVALAAVAVRDGWADATMQAVAAAHVASDAATLAGTSNIQVHGGMGYSAESGAHLYLKRAVLLKRLLPLADAAADILLNRG
jgi:alkylation response protein AidB-like acyl-CoA dehydrogenase